MRGEKMFYKKMEVVLGKNIKEIEGNFHLKLINEPYMRFTFESIGEDEKYRFFAMAHYYEQNGDLVADPDIEFAVHKKTGDLIPMGIMQMGMYKRYFYPDTMKINMAGSKSLMSFLNMWSGNLVSQGFRPKDKVSMGKKLKHKKV